MTNFGLPDPMYAPEALFEPTRVPRQVVVHHQMCALEIDTFSSRVRCNQNLYLAILRETFLGFATFLTPHPAMNLDDSLGAAQQVTNLVDQIFERVAMLRENDEFTVMAFRGADVRMFEQEASLFHPFLIWCTAQ